MNGQLSFNVTSATPSQCARILDVLTDGEWHTVTAIHRVAGYSRLNSRVSELRQRGHSIECRHIDGAGSGPDAYEYRLNTEEANAA